YLEQLKKQGVVQYNTDHLNIPDRDLSLSLKRGKSRLDLVYYFKGKFYECELKTNREVGLDITAIQLKELAKYCEHLIVLVPRGSMEEMATVVQMINLDRHIAIRPYDSIEDQE
ncbi:unnamed protein product, partial [marine sediment metagenome]